MGASGAVLVASSPDRPVQAVGPGWLGRWGDRAAQKPQQFRDGDRDQAGVQLRAGVLLAAVRGVEVVGCGQLRLRGACDAGPAGLQRGEHVLQIPG
jgi:hypothetical protein